MKNGGGGGGGGESIEEMFRTISSAILAHRNERDKRCRTQAWIHIERATQYRQQQTAGCYAVCFCCESKGKLDQTIFSPVARSSHLVFLFCCCCVCAFSRRRRENTLSSRYGFSLDSIFRFFLFPIYSTVNSFSFAAA